MKKGEIKIIINKCENKKNSIFKILYTPWFYLYVYVTKEYTLK